MRRQTDLCTRRAVMVSGAGGLDGDRVSACDCDCECNCGGERAGDSPEARSAGTFAMMHLLFI